MLPRLLCPLPGEAGRAMGTSWSLYSPLALLCTSWEFLEVIDVKVGITSWRLRESALLHHFCLAGASFMEKPPKKPLLKTFVGS